MRLRKIARIDQLIFVWENHCSLVIFPTWKKGDLKKPYINVTCSVSVLPAAGGSPHVQRKTLIVAVSWCFPSFPLFASIPFPSNGKPADWPNSDAWPKLAAKRYKKKAISSKSLLAREEQMFNRGATKKLSVYGFLSWLIDTFFFQAYRTWLATRRSSEITQLLLNVSFLINPVSEEIHCRQQSEDSDLKCCTFVWNSVVMW